MLNVRLRRSITVVIPLFTAALYFGLIEGIFKINASTNIANTGITLGFVFGVLNLYLYWLIWKHQCP
jgi:hypothetical protein